MGTPPSFSAMFLRGDNFFLQFLLTWSSSLPKAETTLKGKNLLYDTTPTDTVGNNENDRVASPESVPYSP